MNRSPREGLLIGQYVHPYMLNSAWVHRTRRDDVNIGYIFIYTQQNNLRTSEWEFSYALFDEVYEKKKKKKKKRYKYRINC